MSGLPDRAELEDVAHQAASDLLRQLRHGELRAPRKELIDQSAVRQARDRGESLLWVPPGAIVTPLARDVAHDLQVTIRERPPHGDPEPHGEPDAEPSPLQLGGPLAFGADHGGFDLKQYLAERARALGIEVQDHGTHSKSSVDYPDLAGSVARAVALGEARWGVLVDGAGIGSCMAANKVPGVLAATCHDARTARNSREHNGANVLCLGSGSLDPDAAWAVLEAWLQTGFGGGRHGRRVDKIRALERSFTR